MSGKKRIHQSTDKEDCVANKILSGLGQIKLGKNTKLNRKKVTLKNIPCEEFADSNNTLNRDAPFVKGAKYKGVSIIDALTEKLIDLSLHKDNILPAKSGTVRDISSEENIFKYDAFCNSPYILHVRMPSIAAKKQISLLSVSN